MRWTLLAFAPFLLCGCLGIQERAQLTQLGQDTRAQIERVELLIKETSDAVKNGTLSVGDGLTKIAQLNDEKQQAAKTYGDVSKLLADKPWYDKMEGWGQIALAVVGSIMGVRLHRGPSSAPFKNSDGTMKA